MLPREVLLPASELPCNLNRTLPLQISHYIPFESEAGFFQLYAQDKYSSARFMRDLGKRFEGADISFKPYPSCRGTHAIVEAALELQKQNGFRARDIAGMKALGSPYFAFLNQTVEPGTAMDAKFSSRYSVASALLDGELTLRSFTPEALRRPEALELGKLLAYEADESVPLQESSNGGMEITLRDGRVLRREMKKPPGHPDNPISFEQLVEKFRDCASYSCKPIPDQRLDDFVGDVLALDKLDNAGRLMAHFSAP